jgi:hypothetical protein
MRFIRTMAVVATTLSIASTAQAQFTYNSPTGTPLPASVSAVGGIVADLIGTNGNRVVAQRAASGLFVGNTPATQFLDIGTQSGFTSTLVSQLGGGLASAAFRVSLFDGDSRSGNFDFTNNWLVINNSRIQNFSAVSTIETNGSGAPVGSGNVADGFGNNVLNTGFFFTSDATALGNIFAALLGGSLTYVYEDSDPGDQFLDFTQGLDASVIDVGQGPVVTPPNTTVPEPATVVLLATGLAAVAAIRRRRAA